MSQVPGKAPSSLKDALTFGHPLSSRDAVAQLSDGFNADDRGILNLFPELGGFEGEVTFVRDELEGQEYIMVTGDRDNQRIWGRQINVATGKVHQIVPRPKGPAKAPTLDTAGWERYLQEIQ